MFTWTHWKCPYREETYCVDFKSNAHCTLHCTRYLLGRTVGWADDDRANRKWRKLGLNARYSCRHDVSPGSSGLSRGRNSSLFARGVGHVVLHNAKKVVRNIGTRLQPSGYWRNAFVDVTSVSEICQK